jgi:hypothetical protein
MTTPHPSRRRTAKRAALALLVLALVLAGALLLSLPAPGLPESAFARPDGRQSVVIAAAPRYRAGAVHRALMGGGYRDAWAAPVRAEVLNLRAFAGGLTPERRGGGNQTRSLRLGGADGRGYVFRSVDKDQSAGLSPLSRAAFGRVRQDQVSALLPAASLVAAAISEAAGVPQTGPRLFVMPDDPALGPHRGAFAGLLGVLEEYPREGPGGAPGFLASRQIEGTEELDSVLAQHPRDAVDTRAYLRARLLDVYLGDWDRHEGQWRWARVERGSAHAWVPIPRDRDYAFVHYGGLFPALARVVDPKIVRFDGAYRDLGGLLVTARALDRRFLCPLPAPAWDSAALSLRAALADSALDVALRRLPPEYARIRGASLARILRERRDNLPTAAGEFRERLHARGGCGQARG